MPKVITRAAISELTEARLECQLLGHAWSEEMGEIDETGVTSIFSGYHYWIRCDRCTKRRLDVLSRIDGRLLTRRYFDPENWQTLEKDESDEFYFMRKDPFRLEMLRRRNELEQPVIAPKQPARKVAAKKLSVVS